MTASIRLERMELAGVEEDRAAWRAGIHHQIVRDSILPRGLAEPWRVLRAGEPAGWVGIWTGHYPGRVMAVRVSLATREWEPLATALRRDAGATEVEVQTNLPGASEAAALMEGDGVVEKLLFEDSDAPGGGHRGGRLRRRRPDDRGPEGPWVLEVGDRMVGAGGWLTHYNPPFADLYMEVLASERGRGYGSALVRTLRAACRAEGWTPAARCDPTNTASAGALLRGGMRRCGEIRVGPLSGG